MKKVISITLAVISLFVLCLFTGCKEENSDIVGKESGQETEEDSSSEKIYLWKKGNVPYDNETERGYNYAFLTPYLAENPNGGGVLVFPGGGYGYLSSSSNGTNNSGDQKEASAIAEWYNAAGISVFVVNYRTAQSDTALNYKQLLSDGTRAVRYLRSHAADYALDEDKIAVQGYSAGGHLAAMLCTQGETEWTVTDKKYTPDEIDGVSARPDAGVLCYAVCSLRDGLTHIGTRNRFSKGITQDPAAFYDEYSAEVRASKTSCPCFIWHEEGDEAVPYGGSEALYNALRALDIECELHVFKDRTTGGSLHGIGTAQSFEEAKEWPTMATNFLKKIFVGDSSTKQN